MTERPPGRSLRAAVPPWLVARALVAAGFVAAFVAAAVWLDERPLPLRQGLRAWDGAWYVDIADEGYGALPREALRFFPLYPLLGRALAVPLFGHTTAALVLVASGSALVLGTLLHRLALEETGDARLARRVAWLLALFPAAAVLAFAYSEALSMALAVATFLALRRRRFGAAGVAGYLAGLSRPVGVALALPAAIEAARGLRGAPWPDRLRRGLAVVGPVAGLATYLAWVAAEFGDIWLPVRVHGAAGFRGGWDLPVVRAWESLTELVTGDHLGDGLHVPFIVGFAALLVVAFRRWPSSYGWYALALVLVALSAESLGSFERYGLAAFPLFLAFATVVEGRARERVAFGLSAAAQVSFTSLVLLGVFVP